MSNFTCDESKLKHSKTWNTVNCQDVEKFLFALYIVDHSSSDSEYSGVLAQVRKLYQKKPGQPMLRSF